MGDTAKKDTLVTKELGILSELLWKESIMPIELLPITIDTLEDTTILEETGIEDIIITEEEETGDTLDIGPKKSTGLTEDMLHTLMLVKSGITEEEAITMFIISEELMPMSGLLENTTSLLENPSTMLEDSTKEPLTILDVEDTLLPED